MFVYPACLFPFSFFLSPWTLFPWPQQCTVWCQRGEWDLWRSNGRLPNFHSLLLCPSSCSWLLCTTLHFGNRLDFVYHLLLVWLVLDLLTTFRARKNPNMEMSFLFGLRFKSMYFPWVLIAFRILLGGFPLSEICGALIGHLYFFLVDVYPATHNGRRIITTPQFLRDMFPAPRAPGQTTGGGINWGRAYRLG